MLLYGANNQAVDDFPFTREPVNRRCCALLIEAVPEARNAFPILAQSSVYWADLIDNWDKLTQSLRVELNGDLQNKVRDPRSHNPNAGISTPHTQNLMAQTQGRATSPYNRPDGP